MPEVLTKAQIEEYNEIGGIVVEDRLMLEDAVRIFDKPTAAKRLAGSHPPASTKGERVDIRDPERPETSWVLDVGY